VPVVFQKSNFSKPKALKSYKTKSNIYSLFYSSQKNEEESQLVEECTGEYEDDDVRNERNKVYRMCASGDADAQHAAQSAVAPVVLVKNLRKEYKLEENCCTSACCCADPDEDGPAKLRVSVRCLSFAVDAGEVLGLLGHNGAGKTTTMKIMTGETPPTHGSVKIGGHNITAAKDDAFKTLGYCPQFDAQWKTMTVREHLELYASIRGVARKDLPRLINTYLHGLRIAEHANKQTQHCSGGTRRKLSYAMAMVGSPRVVLLDEPSTGMDPKSKRFLWDTILNSFQGSRGAILTTHSMEEADALCSRVGIMVKGELRCLGSTQHLKNLYGAGYTLEIKLKHLAFYSESNNSIGAYCQTIPLKITSPITSPTTTVDILFQQQQQSSFDQIQEERVQTLRNFVADLFPDACLEESFADRLVYSVPQHSVVSLAQCFSKLEKGEFSNLSSEIIFRLKVA
jgi:ATP-binding cassette, subfamily A (ABC1), member 5